jgi:hypothetical protein
MTFDGSGGKMRQTSSHIFSEYIQQAGMVVLACNPSPEEAETAG